MVNITRTRNEIVVSLGLPRIQSVNTTCSLFWSSLLRAILHHVTLLATLKTSNRINLTISSVLPPTLITKGWSGETVIVALLHLWWRITGPQVLSRSPLLPKVSPVLVPLFLNPLQTIFS